MVLGRVLVISVEFCALGQDVCDCLRLVSMTLDRIIVISVDVVLGSDVCVCVWILMISNGIVVISKGIL